MFEVASHALRHDMFRCYLADACLARGLAGVVVVWHGDHRSHPALRHTRRHTYRRRGARVDQPLPRPRQVEVVLGYRVRSIHQAGAEVGDIRMERYLRDPYCPGPRKSRY